MEVIRDSEWNSIFSIKHDEKITNAIWKLRKNYKAINDARSKKAIKIIHHSEGNVCRGAATLKTKNIVKCKATTMSGKQCPFRATCGEFCKKHNPKIKL
jgi:hypothetical protein